MASKSRSSTASRICASCGHKWNALPPTSDQIPRSLRLALDHLNAEIEKLHEEAAIAA
jgi:hypothetical protein